MHAMPVGAPWTAASRAEGPPGGKEVMFGDFLTAHVTPIITSTPTPTTLSAILNVNKGNPVPYGTVPYGCVELVN
jgi:hypothetical protein